MRLLSQASRVLICANTATAVQLKRLNSFQAENYKGSVLKESGFCGREKFLQKKPGKAARIVPDDAVFFEKVVEDHAEAKLLQRGKVDGDGLGSLGAVTAGDIGRNRLAIGDDPIDYAAGDVSLDGAEMIGEGVAGSFAGLGHEIGDIDARSFGFDDGGRNFWDKKIGEDAGVKRAGA